jgi:hypothetical protein
MLALGRNEHYDGSQIQTQKIAAPVRTGRQTHQNICGRAQVRRDQGLRIGLGPGCASTAETIPRDAREADAHLGRPLVTTPITFIFGVESKVSGASPGIIVRFGRLVVYLPIENPDVPMMFRGTKLLSPRGSGRVNVETIGGRRSRQLLPKSRLRNQTGWSAPHLMYPR